LPLLRVGWTKCRRAERQAAKRYNQLPQTDNTTMTSVLTKYTLIFGLFLLTKDFFGQKYKTFNDSDFKLGDLILTYIPSSQPDVDQAILLDKKSTDSLRPLADFIKAHKNMTFEIQSHFDSRVKFHDNMKRSQIHAENIRDKLIKNYQVDSLQISARGYGATKMLVADEEIKKAKTKIEKEALHSKNRRTLLLVTKVN
jgi:predicted GIY-YIG superfamily endonuclease